MTAQRSVMLLAEDDPNDALLFQRAIDKVCRHACLQHVRDGEECIRYLKGDPPFEDRERHAFPAVLLLDLKMPREDGFSVLKWLRDHPERSCPVIVLTGSIMPQDKVRSFELGAQEFHTKPAAFEDLVALACGFCSRYGRAGATPVS